MAEEHREGGGGGGAMSDLLWLLFFLFIIFVAWFAVGGPAKADFGSLFLQSPGGIFNASSTPGAGVSTSTDWFPVSYPGSGGGTANPGNPLTADPAFTDALNQLKNTPSQAQGSVVFNALYGAQATDPSKEFIEIQANQSNPTSINISGWRIQSMKTGRMAVIGTAIETPLSGQGGTPGAVVLMPGERAEIVTGRSPTGTSFRVNKCSGYFGQFQTFTPALAPLCPSALGELYASGGQLSSENACVMAAAKIGPCRVLTGPPTNVSSTCGQFLTRVLSYNSCVQLHQNDSDFRQNEWRIYEGNVSELWVSTGDTLVLLDQRGRLVSSTSY